MKNVKKVYVFLPVLGLIGILGAGSASAHGFFGGFGSFGSFTPEQIAQRQTAAFQSQAQVLGINIDELKNAWAEGKSPKEIMTEKGIKEEDVQARMKELRTTELEIQLQGLVDKGVITQVQADKRLKVMQERMQNAPAKFGRMGMKGLRHGW